MKIEKLRRFARDYLPDGCELQLTICTNAVIEFSIHDYENHITYCMREGLYADFLPEDDPANDEVMVNKASILSLLNEVRLDRQLDPVS